MKQAKRRQSAGSTAKSYYTKQMVGKSITTTFVKNKKRSSSSLLSIETLQHSIISKITTLLIKMVIPSSRIMILASHLCLNRKKSTASCMFANSTSSKNFLFSGLFTTILLSFNWRMSIFASSYSTSMLD